MICFLFVTFSSCENDVANDNVLKTKYQKEIIDPQLNKILETDTISMMKLKDENNLKYLIHFLSENAREKNCFKDINEEYFDIKKIDDSKNIRLAHFSRNDCIYYTFFHNELGPLYVVEFDFENCESFSLIEYQDYNKKAIDSLVDLCKRNYMEYFEHLKTSIIYPE